LPKGQGKIEESSAKFFPVGVAEPWFKLQPGITGVSGKFKKGQPEGKGQIKYTDGSTLQGTFVNGRINGKARLFTGYFMLSKTLFSPFQCKSLVYLKTHQFITKRI
jgi:hypothetical protein